MKKFILSLGLIAMALNLTNCAQYEDATTPANEPKGDFELFASTSSTAASTSSRTANDGLNTVWSADDALNVFHAVAEGTTYTNDGEFTLENAADRRFLGTLNGALTEEAYDWYAIYPYHSSRTTPASTNVGWCGIGGQTNAIPVQEGYNSKAHLAGENFPLVGIAKGVEVGTSPSVSMKNIASVLGFNVINTIDADIIIKEVRFTAPEDIFGTYYINFTDLDNIAFTKSGAQYVSTTATVKVSNGAVLTKGESAKVYMGIKPFTAAAGSELTINVVASVNGIENTYTKTIEVENATSFVGGKLYENIKVNYFAEIPSEDEEATVTETIDFSKAGYENGNTVVSHKGTDCSIEFAKGSNSNSAPKYYTTGSAIRCYGGNTFTISSDLNIVKVVFTFASGEDKNTITADSGSFITDTWVGSANSVKFTIGGSSGHRRIQKMEITYGEAKPMIVATDPAAVAYNATSATINYELLVVEGVVTATTDADWITAIDTTEAGKVKLTLAENPAYANRSANVTLSIADAEDVIVKVTQNAKPRPTISVSATELSVEAEETEVIISYSSSNLIGGVTANVDAEWVTGVNTNTTGQVVLTFAANESTESRQVKVTLSTQDATSSPVVTVTQKGVGSEVVVVSWKKESWSKFTTTSESYSSHTVVGDLGSWSFVGCSAYENAKTQVVKDTGYKYATMGKTADNSKITSPSFTNGIQGLKFKYYANNTARKFTVTVYENGTAKKTVTVTPASANGINSYSIDVTTTGSTYFTFAPTTSNRRVSIGEIEVLY